MKKISVLMMTAALVTTLAACSDEPNKAVQEPKKEASETNKIENSSQTGSLSVSETTFSVENWKTSNMHHKEIMGSLTLDGKPVVGANIQLSDKRTVATDEKGEFTMTIDANIVQKVDVHVASLDKATWNGKSLDKKTKDKLLSLKEELVVYYPIEVEKVEANAKDDTLVDVHARALVPENEKFPTFSVEKYKVGGTVKDADGKPVKGATVSLRRDGVEGFSMSEPSNENGEFTMYYIPEDDENHYLFVHLPDKSLSYTLPENKGFLFPDDEGVNIDITLPKEGTVIDDKPPTLVATEAEGALYKGVLMGLNASKDVDYTITIPEKDGSFRVTLPKSEWEKNPTFYQINYTGFHEDELKLGDELSNDVIRHPNKNEPNEVQAIKK